MEEWSARVKSWHNHQRRVYWIHVAQYCVYFIGNKIRINFWTARFVVKERKIAFGFCMFYHELITNYLMSCGFLIFTTKNFFLSSPSPNFKSSQKTAKPNITYIATCRAKVHTYFRKQAQVRKVTTLRDYLSSRRNQYV